MSGIYNKEFLRKPCFLTSLNNDFVLKYKVKSQKRYLSSSPPPPPTPPLPPPPPTPPPAPLPTTTTTTTTRPLLQIRELMC